jgi:hypothetical protein
VPIDRDQPGETSTRTVGNYLRSRLPGVIDAPMNFADVADAAMGHLLAADKGKPGERYILGGVNMSWPELIDCVAEVSGHRHPLYGDRLAGWATADSPRRAATAPTLIGSKPSGATRPPATPHCSTSPTERADACAACRLDVDGQPGRARFGERFGIAVGILDHQVDVEGHLRHFLQRRHDRHTDGDVRHEVTVHHIDVDQVGPARFSEGNRGTKRSKVRGEDRRRNLDRSCHR